MHTATISWLILSPGSIYIDNELNFQSTDQLKRSMQPSWGLRLKATREQIQGPRYMGCGSEWGSVALSVHIPLTPTHWTVGHLQG